MERSAEFCRGAVAVLGRMVDECSTVFDSDLPHITQGNLEDYLAEYAELLAAAEAREAAQPTAAEVIEAAEKAMKKTQDLGALHHREDASETCFDWCPACHQDAALALIARYKEAHGGK